MAGSIGLDSRPALLPLPLPHQYRELDPYLLRILPTGSGYHINHPASHRLGWLES